MSFYRGPGGTGTGSVTTIPVQITEGGTGATSASGARTNLGLGTMALQNTTNVSITGGAIVGITDVAVADGGTGASTAAGARTNLFPSYSGNGSKVLALNAGATDVEWTTNGNGTVTSVAATVPTGLSVAGSPVTTSGTLAITYTAGYAIPTTAKQTDWDTAFGWGDHSVAGYLDSADIGVTVQGYDADTAKYDDVTANFTGTLQNGGSNVVVDTDIGVTVQAYDATILDSADIGVSVQGYDADTAKYDDVTANFTGTLQNGGNTVLTTASTIEGGTY